MKPDVQASKPEMETGPGGGACPHPAETYSIE